MEERVEHIVSAGRLLASVVRAAMSPDATTFVTDPSLSLQVGFIVYPAGAGVAAHAHSPIQRAIVGMSEVLIVKRGRCIVDVYTDDRVLVASPELGPGDVILLVGGGHGCRMLEDTVLLEVKQGPYAGPDEKSPFPSGP